MIESLEVRSAGRMPGYPYEWTAAVAHYAVDPAAPANARIADLDRAPRDDDGLVRFSGDVVLLHPDGGGNRRALLTVPNRGTVRLPYCGAGALPEGPHDLGELVICAPVVAREAREQRKTARAHWAHLTVHGVLHLLGFDHEQPRDARLMELREIQILDRLGFSDPYS